MTTSKVGSPNALCGFTARMLTGKLSVPFADR
jgi:hypothetical protein